MIDKDELHKAIIAGLTVKEIALKLNITQYLVKKSLKFYGFKTSPHLKNWDIGRLIKLSHSCNSKREILDRMGKRDSSANYITLDKIADSNNINLPNNFIIQNGTKLNSYLSNEEFFVENSDRKGPNIKKRLLKMGVKEECAICKIGTMWNDIPLNHHIDHINGVHTDNRLENLRLLCPNCHSQQETTHRNKISRKKFYYCVDCDNEINRRSERCQKCSNILKNAKRRKFDPSVDDLKKVLTDNDYNMSAVGRYYGVSDNAVRKRCKSLNIDFRKLSVV